MSAEAPPAPLRIVIADDDDLLRDALSYLIDDRDGLTIVGQAADGAEAVQLAENLAPDLVLMDIRMPVLDGLDATLQIKARPNPPRVLVLTVVGQDQYVYQAFRNGADGFLPKRVRSEDLEAAIRTVASGHALIAPEITRTVIDRFITLSGEATDLIDYGLTDREIDVLAQLASGQTNDEIARRLEISDHTVKTHLSSIFSKTGCTTRVQAVIFAYDHGLVRPRPRLGVRADDRPR